MGWGTSFNAEIYLNKQLYYSMGEIEDAIQDRQEDIQRAREVLLMTAMAHPNDLTTEGQDTLYAIRNIINEQLETIEESVRDLLNLKAYQEAIEEGKASLSKRETINDYNNDLC